VYILLAVIGSKSMGKPVVSQQERDMIFRRYTPADRSTCIAILDSNMPRFFSHQDRREFLAFLEAPVGTYNILEQEEGHIIGCGGIATRDEEQTGILTWGMLHRDYHRQGWGRQLAFLRLRQLSAYPALQKITLNTSQESAGFFEKMGFHSTEFLPNFYCEGLHCVKMELQVDGEFEQRLATIEAQLRYPL
jgi:N-acetylglutamate synthase-like GNAT family acetyltransferase